MMGDQITRIHMGWRRRIKNAAPSAFSLVEIAIALGILAFALIAVVGLLPVGLKVLRESEESMATKLIFLDIASKLDRYTSRPSLFRDPNARSLRFVYDESGLFVGESTTDTLPTLPANTPHLTPAYLAAVTIGPLATYPSGVSAEQLLGVDVKITSLLRTGTNGTGEMLDEYGFYLPMMADNAWPQ
jgi:uncharacterized protein (TIGR02598 family)